MEKYKKIIESLMDYLSVNQKYLIDNKLKLRDLSWHIDDCEKFIDISKMNNIEKMIFYQFLCPKITI